MAVNRNYRRKSIILNEQDNGYRIDNSKIPVGYAKLEVKSGNGILTTFVQNLKFFEDGSYIYRVFMAITGRQPVLLNLGTIVIDERGKGERVWRFNAHNVDGTGFCIDKFDLFGIMVYRTGSESEACGYPLAGSTGKLPGQWREVLKEMVSEVSDTEIPDVGVPVSEAPGEELERIETEEEPVPEENLKREEAVSPPEVENKDEDIEAGKDDEETGYKAVADEKAEHGPEAEQGYETGEDETGKHEVEEDKNNSYKSEDRVGFDIEEYMSGVLNGFPRVEPFEIPVEHCIWWKVNTFNYIFGLMNDTERNFTYYAYGVPGAYNKQIEKQMGMYGFYGWRSAKGSQKKEGDRGYWLAFIDARTGMLVNPRV